MEAITWVILLFNAEIMELEGRQGEIESVRRLQKIEGGRGRNNGLTPNVCHARAA